jgi:hypothetical protein
MTNLFLWKGACFEPEIGKMSWFFTGASLVEAGLDFLKKWNFGQGFRQV